LAVKRSQSAARVLAALEQIARHQPIGVSALARLLDADKSALQRDVMTLADAGWIRAAPGPSTQWELAPYAMTIAQLPASLSGLRMQARAALDALRQEINETVYLMAPDRNRFIVVDAIESRPGLRMFSPLGIVAQVRRTATGRAFLAGLPPQGQLDWLGEPPDAATLADFARVRQQGYAVSDGEMRPGSIAIAAPIFGLDQRPEAAICITGTSERLPPDRWAAIGEATAAAAMTVSAAQTGRERIAAGL